MTDEKFATRKAYGTGLVKLGKQDPQVVALDAETSNSTYAATFKDEFPDRFIECYIAEQNMVSMAVGLSRMGFKPYVSTFAAFFTRCFDQIRMARYSEANISFVGSHSGVSIGEDGTSQMGLEDISMFRSILDSVVVYPADKVSTEKLLVAMNDHSGISYMRTTRADTNVLYTDEEEFHLGGSKTLTTSKDDKVTVIGAGITLHEALKAYEELANEGINIRAIDLYSIKPIDVDAIKLACQETGNIVVVEDHYQAGGIYEAVLGTGLINCPIHSLCVQKMPRSGTPQELLEYEEIDAKAIVTKVKEIIK